MLMKVMMMMSQSQVMGVTIKNKISCMLILTSDEISIEYIEFWLEGCKVLLQ